MRQAEKEKKKFYFRIPFMLDRGKKISKKKIAKKLKKFKNLFPTYFQPKGQEIGRERGKKFLLPNAVHTRPGHENFEKNSKKIEQI